MPVAGWTAGPPGSAGVRRPRRWIAVLVTVLVVVAMAGIAGTALFFSRSWPPFRATLDFTSDLEDGRYHAAFSQICARDRARISASQFTVEVRGLLGSRVRSISPNPLSVDRSGDTATVEFTVEHRRGHDPTYELPLVQERGDWHPCSFS
jgi:hypothetical protein